MLLLTVFIKCFFCTNFRYCFFVLWWCYWSEVFLN